jgi:hypothetical protein
MSLGSLRKDAWNAMGWVPSLIRSTLQPFMAFMAKCVMCRPWHRWQTCRAKAHSEHSWSCGKDPRGANSFVHVTIFTYLQRHQTLPAIRVAIRASRCARCLWNLPRLASWVYDTLTFKRSQQGLPRSHKDHKVLSVFQGRSMRKTLLKQNDHLKPVKDVQSIAVSKFFMLRGVEWRAQGTLAWTWSCWHWTARGPQGPLLESLSGFSVFGWHMLTLIKA